MKNKNVESMPVFLKRKLTNCASGIYRAVVYPFVKAATERKYNSIIGKHSYLRENTKLEGHNFIGDNVELSNVSLGYGTVVTRGSIASNTRIGRYCCIGSIETYIGNHPVKGENISVHAAFYSTAGQFGFTYVDTDSFEEATYIDKENKIQIDIGNDVWFGRGVRVLAGVTIGDGAVIGAGSLVTKSVEPYAIYAGIPAKKVGMRFSDEAVKCLLANKWWEKDQEWIEANADKFRNPGEFIHYLQLTGK